ncbi:MAG: hypothetical protein HKO87_01375 [Acidimicrobiia bacterium]|nr:hypothetical protein [Acidimicrobiia bacterium]
MDVCNAGQDFICDWIWDITGNERVAEVVDWVVERPLKVAVILLIAYVINRVVSDGLKRAWCVTGTASSTSARSPK